MSAIITTREQRRQLARDNAKRSAILTPIPREQWPDLAGMKKMPYAVWRSRDFLVQCFAERDGVSRLSVARAEVGSNGRWVDGISWDDLQTVKRQVGLRDYYAIEVYPKDSEIVNVANMRHLWVLRDPLDIGWFKS
jgi:hypothetical protein